MSKQLIGIICKPFVKLFESQWIYVDETDVIGEFNVLLELCSRLKQSATD